MSAHGDNRDRNDAGFTLLELLIALAIAGLLLGIGLPSFKGTLQDVQLVGEQNALVRAVRRTRSEAIKNAVPATLCASEDGASCSGTWSDGWLAFADTGSGAIGSFQTGDTVIEAHQPVDDRFGISGSAIIRPSAEATVTRVRFGPRGRADWTLGTLVVCDERGPAKARALIINGAGGLRTVQPDDAVAKDASGNAVTCPGSDP